MSKEVAEYLSESVNEGGISSQEDALADKQFETLRDREDSFILFELGSDQLAIELASVREIVEHETPCVIPTTNEISAGVINLRGQVIPVLNLAKRLDLTAGKITRNSSILLVEVSYAGQVSLLGLMIDRVLRIAGVKVTDQSKVPEFGLKISGEYVKSMLTIDEAFIPSVNLETACNIYSLSSLIVSAES